MKKSQQAFIDAQQFLPGGVNSPVRAFNGVGGTPVFMQKALGPHVFDIDGKRYIDYVLSWGPMILGHAHPQVIAAVQAACEQGLSFGAPTERETELAKLICKLMPNLEKIRLVNSGTEATMTALRLARGVTGRNKIVKFEGCYHGHVDSLLVKAGSGALTLGVPTSPGISANLAAETLALPYNDSDAVHQLFQQQGQQIAAIMVEPVAGNMNLVVPDREFLQTLRTCCDQYGSLLIFDEVMTGFRVSQQGAQGYFAIRPDLTCLGKVVGGGMPLGAVGGSAQIMNHLAPAGPVYQAGTLSGNPIATMAGLTTLQLLDNHDFYPRITALTTQLLSGLQQAADQAGIAFTTAQAGSMFGLFFTEKTTIRSYAEVTSCSLTQFQAFFHAMLAQGMYLAPSAFEAGFMSITHDATIIEQTLTAAKIAFAALATEATH
jgi:glutamate-1-semialdehyde 2,1-aminomutase